MLVPEIALTPAMAAAFRARFGDRVAIQHSGLSDGERHDQWHRIRRGDVEVVIGTRSAIFAPLARPGLIIVDEEHDTSYKQEETPRYHGRDVAIMRGKFADALVVLGSATPSLESFFNARQQRYALDNAYTAGSRSRRSPRCASSTCARSMPLMGRTSILSRAARDGASPTDSNGASKSLVLLNRRGYATSVFCRQCGHTMDCPNCSVSLTVHTGRQTWRARCHYCNFSRVVPEAVCQLRRAVSRTRRVRHRARRSGDHRALSRRPRRPRRSRHDSSTRQFDRPAESFRQAGPRRPGRHADDRQGPRFSACHAGGRDLGRRRARDGRFPRGRAHVPTPDAGRRPRRARRTARARRSSRRCFPGTTASGSRRRRTTSAFFDKEIEFRRAMRYPPVIAMVNVVVRGKTLRRRDERQPQIWPATAASYRHRRADSSCSGPRRRR